MTNHLVEDLNQLQDKSYSSKSLLSLLLQNINFVLLLGTFLLKKINNSYFLNLYPFIYFLTKIKKMFLRLLKLLKLFYQQ